MSTKNIQHRNQYGIALTLLAVALGFTSAAMAGNLNLSNNALEVVIGVEPNILIVNDDSGSMDWMIMVEDQDDGLAHLPSNTATPGKPNRYHYTHPNPGASGDAPATNAYPAGSAVNGVLPTEEHLMAEGLTQAQTDGVWRYWFSDYNRIYYNPDATYMPWGGVDSSNNAYDNVTPTAAPYDPYRTTSTGSLDLTATTSYGSSCTLAVCQADSDLDGTGDNAFTVTNFYPARYYTWTDDSGGSANSVIDADDGHALVEIKSAQATYTGRLAYDESTGRGRSDCTDQGDGTATCTYAQEIQNFANWFSYYRKRDLSAKAAFSLAIDPAENARIGYATLNNRDSVKLAVASMNISSSSGVKKTLLGKVFDTNPGGGTPLRTALRNSGRYFDCASNNTPSS